LQEFETTLKEVVNAKRLSASKVEKLNQLALKLMEHDTQLVSTLYRTHKSSSGTHKINSLYVFDALARAARHQVDKHKLDVHAIVGNCATFLVKMEGVLDGLFQDILSSGLPEAKEKTKKILDIWLKFNTFPSAVLTSLHKLVKEHDSDKGKGKGAYHVSVLFAKYSSIRGILPFVMNEVVNVRCKLKYHLVCVRTRQNKCSSDDRPPNTCGRINYHAATGAGARNFRGV
ncbi:hypothetical protein BC629DRAFT_1292195, partial [Irpex lacteus]